MHSRSINSRQEIPLEEPFQVGPWRVSPTESTIRDATGEVHVPPQPMKLLCLLAARPDETVSREGLADALWGKRVVNEEGLSRCVAELRRYLKDDSRTPSFIKTVPKKGYRLIRTVRPASPIPLRGFAPRPRVWMWLAGLALIGMIGLVRFPGDAPVDPLVAARRITAEPGLESEPELSRDGRWLAYSHEQQGRSVITVVSTTTPDNRRTIEAETSLISPVFSPDASELAVAAADRAECAVTIIQILGSESRELGSCLVMDDSPLLDWSDDGRFIALSDRSRDHSTAAIWVADVRTGNRQQITRPPDSYYYDTRPRFHPDGDRIAFTRGTRGARELFVTGLPPAAGDPRQLTFDHNYIVSFDWKPPGEHIVFDSDRAGYRALWILDPAVESPRLLGARDGQYPSFSAAGDLGFQIARFEANIWPVDLRSGIPAQRPLVQSSKYDAHPAYSPDGARLAFSSNRSGVGAIWIVPAGGGEPYLAFQLADRRAGVPTWSPDGEKLLATVYGQGGQSIYVIDVAARTGHRLAAAGQRAFGGQYSHEGDWIYFVVADPGEGAQLWRIAADESGEPRQVTVNGGNRLMPVGDGSLLYSLPDAPGLHRLWPDSGESHPVVAELESRFWDDWTYSKGTIYYPRRSPEGPYKIWKTELETGSSSLVTDLRPAAFGPTLAVDPAASTLLVVRTDRADSDVFLATAQD